MTDIEALRARVREAARGADYLEVPVDDFLALDAYTTRLREDLDRVTRERDEAIRRGEDQWTGWVKCDVERKEAVIRAEAAEAALAKRGEAP